MGKKWRVGSGGPASSLPLAVLCICCAGLILSGADDPGFTIRPRSPTGTATDGADRTAPDFHVDANLVLIPVLVTDHNDRLITGLGKEHFKVFENRVEQVITQFGSVDTPVSIALVVDCSGSMGPKLDRSRAAVAEFLRTSNPEDEFMLVTFNDEARLLTRFTREVGEIQNQMIFIRSHGRTALIDAIYLALNEMRQAQHARKAILILSDGGDNSSRYSYHELRNLVREADVQIYSIGILDPADVRSRTPEELAGPALLHEIAAQTGGRLYTADYTRDLSVIASKIGAALRNEYVLGYSPSEPQRDGKYHRIQVKIEPPKGLPKVHATFRSGYYSR